MSVFNKKTAIIIHDFIMTVIAWQVSWWLRFNLDIPDNYLEISLYTLPMILLVQGLVFWRFSLYRGLWRFSSLPDLWNIFRAAVFGALCITLVLFISIRLEDIPRSILIMYPVFLIFLLGGPRLGYRVWKDHSFNFKSGIPLRTLPKIHDMVSGKVVLSDLREVLIEDLLGREKVELDWKIIQQGITNKVVLVSGGGGSIGSELCKQISALNPAVLVIFERNEFNLYNIQRMLENNYPSLKMYAILGDICDRAKVDHVVANYKPDVIFHAAAYKHVPILQNQSREAIKNNIIGTKILAEFAVKYNCNKFVFISTDKAVNPANVLGASKRAAEMYCEWMNIKSNTRFVTVRFGNVLDSDGSVVPLFREQIKNGGPITVTHPEITRFFMTVREACQLILQAGAMGEGGEIYVLDMGEPVKINYLAEQMIKLSGRVPGEEIMIVYTGLRPGEKLFEELFYENEHKDSTVHPKILLARHPAINLEFLPDKLKTMELACNEFDEDKLKALLHELAPELQSQPQQNNVVPLNKIFRDAKAS